MFDLVSQPLWINIVALLLAAIAIGISGMKLAGLGDHLADRTGLGEAVTGVVFLGLTTALPGLAASVSAALDGRPALAISNAIGGIALQTTFLAVADVTYRRANLEHAAASVANMIQTVMLIILLLCVMIGLTGPDMAIAHVHPVSIALPLVAVAGIFLVYRSGADPMWEPKHTKDTVADEPLPEHQSASLSKLVIAFLINAAVVILAGIVVAESAGNIADDAGLNEALVGAFIVGVITSLPELVTTVAAVRKGALTLAVSDVVGGNFFDVLFVFAADVAYLNGSLYHAEGVGDREEFLTALAILLNVVFLLGLLYRQRKGPANIGFESVSMILLYLGGLLLMTLSIGGTE